MCFSKSIEISKIKTFVLVFFFFFSNFPKTHYCNNCILDILLHYPPVIIVHYLQSTCPKNISSLFSCNDTGLLSCSHPFTQLSTSHWTMAATIVPSPEKVSTVLQVSDTYPPITPQKKK
jgi:hypothetical protein